MQVQPYLFFTGDCEKALEFYRSIFGGVVAGVNRYEGSPLESHVPPDWKQKIMHWGASLGMVTDKFGIEWMVNAGGAEAEHG